MPSEVTLFFESGKDGWSEKYYHSSLDPKTLNGDTLIMAKDRAALLGFGANITGYRFSNVDQDRDGFLTSYIIGPGDDAQLKSKNSLDPTQAGSGTDFSGLGVLVEFRNGSNIRNRIFMRGQCEAIVGPPAPGKPSIYNESVGSWANNFTRWSADLINGAWRLKHIQKPPTVPLLLISAMDRPTGDLLRLTTSAPHAITDGSQVFIRKGRQTKASDYALPTGQFKVSVPDNTHLLLYGTNRKYLGLDNLGAALNYSPLSSKVYPIVAEYDPIESIVAQRPITRKTGRPFDSVRGRRRPR